MSRASGPGALLIIIPAYNEEAAISKVVHEVRAVQRGTPILVIDDCSFDSTRALANRPEPKFLPCLTISDWVAVCKPDTSWLSNSAMIT